MKRLMLMAAAASLLAVGFSTTGARADLTPWEKFCLHTAKPGKDLGNCLDGLPSQGVGGFAVKKKAKTPSFQAVQPVKIAPQKRLRLR